MASIFRDTESLSMSSLSLVLVGPSEERRRALARGLAGSQATIAREIPRYPNLDDLPHVLEPDCDVVVVDLDPDPERALDVVESLCGRNGSVTVMVYSAHANQELLVRCMRAGARELLAEPLLPNAAGEALVRASVRRDEVRRHKTVTGKLFVFVGAKGGAGVTTVATNFAVALAHYGKVALVDLDLQLGDAALMLGLNANFTVLDALENLHRLDSDFLSGLTAKHASGLAVLGAPDMIPSLQPSNNGMERLLRIAREDFAYVVVDAGSHSIDMYELLFNAATTTYLVAQVSIADLRNANRFVSRYFTGAEVEKLDIVLNRYVPRNFEIDEAAITKALTRPAKWKVPNDFAAARRAQNSSGAAISGATVSYSGGSITTAANGSYTLANVPAGTVSLTASATGLQNSTQNVAVTANTTTTQNFTLTSAATTGTIIGTVTNSSGTAISGATVSYSGGSTTTAANGSYTLANVPAGTVSVTASATGFQSSTQSVAVTANNTTTQNFTLSAAVTTGTITGNVTDSTGTAISGATVSYTGGSTTTAANGSYTLANVPAGTVSVTASATGFQSSTQSVTVTANNTTTQNFLLSAAAQGISISGTISPASIGNGTSMALSGPAPVLVQSASGAAASGSSTVTMAFGAAAGAKNTILVFVRFGNTTISDVTDNQTGGSNTYTSVLGPTKWGVAPNSTDREAQAFVAKNIAGGTKLTVTVRFAASSNHTVYATAVEYSGVDPANPVNATAVGTGTVSANGAPTTPNLTTTIANAKLVATSEDSNESYTATGNGTGFTTDVAAGIASISGGKGWPSLTEDMTAVTPGAWKATTSSASGVNDWVIMLVALTPAPSQTVTADVNGNYTLSNVTNGTFTVTPTKSGSTFTPANRTVTVNGSSLTGVNFTGQ